MTIGPVEYIIVGSRNKFNGEIAPELVDLVDPGRSGFST